MMIGFLCICWVGDEVKWSGGTFYAVVEKVQGFVLRSGWWEGRYDLMWFEDECVYRDEYG